MVIRFLVTVGFVLTVGVAAAWLNSTEPATLVGAHYFTWYRGTSGDRWGNDATTVHAASPRPLLGEYNSRDIALMDAHIAQMERAGIDFAIVHIVAGSRESWASAEQFVDRLGGDRLRFAVMLDGLYGAAAEVKQDWVMKAEPFTAHPQYLRVEGTPLVMLFSAKIDFAVPGTTLRNVYWTPEYRDGLNTFNGGPLEPHDWAFWAPTPQPLVNGMVPVIPGYSDTHLRREIAMEHPRDDGRLYHEQWRRALELKPAFVLVYGWNEYFEQTMIEPTDAWGERYLRWTACYAALAHAGQTGSC